MSRSIAVVAILVCVAATGCSDPQAGGEETTQESDAGSEDVDDAPTGEPVAPDEFADAFAKAYCSAIFDCCGETERESITYGNVEDEETCIGQARSHFQQADIEGADEDDSVEYDAQKAGDCLALVEQGCDYAQPSPFEFTEQCEPYLEPQLEKGDECTRFGHCKTGHCEGVTTDPDEDEEQVGVCATPETGDVCEIFGCGDSHYCDVDNDRGEFVCYPLKEDGEECREPFECSSDYCGDRDPEAGDFDGTCAPKPDICTGE
ncbi:MAG: hypothetical protein ACOCV2_07830 [Persicimonas sp.]